MTITESRGRAEDRLQASPAVTALDDLIDTIRIEYRLAKSAEQARIRIDQGLYAFTRVFLTDWHPQADEKARKQAAERARKAVDGIRKGKEPSEHDAPLHMVLLGLVTASQASWDAFDDARKQHRRAAERAVVHVPAWQRLQHIRGFSTWGLAVIIGEAGDIGGYSGCRKLFKRLGLAPDECYPKGEKHTGRMIPRNSRGRVMGVIANPLLRAQWRGAKEDSACQGDADSHRASDRAIIPAHAIGPFGEVYGAAKANSLSKGRTKGHAEKAARRAMVKALLHDVHAAWHERELDYAKME